MVKTEMLKEVRCSVVLSSKADWIFFKRLAGGGAGEYGILNGGSVAAVLCRDRFWILNGGGRWEKNPRLNPDLPMMEAVDGAVFERIPFGLFRRGSDA